MEDDEETPSASGMLPTALSILGIVLGGAALFFAINAGQRIGPLSASMEARSSGEAALEGRVEDLSTQLSEMEAQLESLDAALNRVRTYGNQSERAIKQLATELNTNREQIVKTAERLNELATRSLGAVASTEAASGTGGGAAPADADPDANPDADPGVESEASRRTYAVEAGDNFVRIASKTGVSLQALIDANPDVDPRRMQIGQQIKIPQE